MNSNSHLVPTRTMRSDGHMTTVHRKLEDGSKKGNNALPAPSLGTSGKKPSGRTAARQEGTTHPNDGKSTKIGWELPRRASVYGKNRSSLIHELGIAPKNDHDPHNGSVTMTQGEVFEYLRLGISVNEAGYLQSIKPLDEWERDSKFNDLMPGSLSYWGVNRGGPRRVSIEAAVDLMHESGTTTRNVQKMLRNGFNDSHINKGVLKPEQLERVFSRFKYQPSIEDGKETNASATINALLDGRLPYEAFERFDRGTLTGAMDAVYPSNRSGTWATALDEQDRHELQENPQSIIDIMAVMDDKKVHGMHFRETHYALNKYGEEACREYHPLLLTKQRVDGTEFGVSGARDCVDFYNHCIDNVEEDSALSIMSHPSTEPDRMSITREVIARTEEILEMKDGGLSNQDITDKLLDEGMRVDQVLALVRGESKQALVDGWL